MGRSININVGIKGFKQGTNVLEIEVPEQLRKRCKVGIPWLQDALGGAGFAPSTCMMLTGGPGCGKTTMLMQLADALMGQGHVVLYNTGEESLYQVKMVAERLKLKNGFFAGQDIMMPNLLAHADKIKKQNPGKQMFLLQDSLQTLNDGFYSNGGTTGNTPMRCCEMLTDWAKSTFGIVAFVGQVNKDGQFAGKNGIKHAIDVHGHFYFDDDKRSETWGERLFEITKNRFGCSGKTYIIGIDKTGLFEKGHFNKAGSYSADPE